MSRYAESTTVSPERSQQEISATLRRYGANGFLFGWQDTRAMVGFTAHGRQVRFLLDMPNPDDPSFFRTPTGRRREDGSAAYEQEVRRRWRALALAIKAKLEAVNTGITTFEEEFLAHIVLPDGTLVGAYVQPEIARAYESGEMPMSLLPPTRRAIASG